jgi:hypothetical protein
MVPPALVEQPWQGWGLQGHREVVEVWEEAAGGVGGGMGGGVGRGCYGYAGRPAHFLLFSV